MHSIKNKNAIKVYMALWIFFDFINENTIDTTRIKAMQIDDVLEYAMLQQRKNPNEYTNKSIKLNFLNRTMAKAQQTTTTKEEKVLGWVNPIGSRTSPPSPFIG